MNKVLALKIEHGAHLRDLRLMGIRIPFKNSLANERTSAGWRMDGGFFFSKIESNRIGHKREERQGQARQGRRLVDIHLDVRDQEESKVKQCVHCSRTFIEMMISVFDASEEKAMKRHCSVHGR